ncbi:MAG: hypothetical protein K8R21_04035 [Leptospira sp.]|nr:hypothetical protein [Leptospira sp.]
MGKKILKIFLMFITVLAISEISLRVLRPEALEFYRIQKNYHRLDPDYFVDLEPNVNVRVKHFLNFYNITFSTNESGFRATDSIDNSFPQIACIGDSVTMGFGVDDEDTFCRKLNGFRDSSGKIFKSVNLGVDAYGPTAISLKLEKYLPLLNTKILYYFPSTGDEIDERAFFERKANPGADRIFKLQFLATKYSYLALAAKISQEQLTYRFLETFLWPVNKLNKTIDCRNNKFPQDECTEVYSAEFSLTGEFLRKPPVPKNQPPVFPAKECSDTLADYNIPDFMLKSIDKIIMLSKTGNIKLVMVLLPIDVETAYCSQRGRQHHFYTYLTTLKKYLESKKVDVIDMNQMTGQMKDDKGRLNPRPYYIPGDGHYTKLGNQWVAGTLLRKTKEMLK